MADDPLITSQLETLAARLPAPLFAEVADGLHETYQDHLALQPNPRLAAQAAIAEFGDADLVSAALCRQALWRRHAAALLATGPLLGGIWATLLISQHAWLWPLPELLRPLYAATLILVIGLLARAVLERHRYQHGQRRVLLGAALLIALDLLAGAIALSYATTTGWIITVALTASALRTIGAGVIGAQHLLSGRDSRVPVD